MDRRRWCSGVWVGLVWAASAAGTELALVPQGSFERGPEAAVAAGWQVHDGLAVEKGDAFHGAYCVRIRFVGKPDDADAHSAGTIKDRIPRPVPPRQQITERTSVWVATHPVV